MAAHLPPKEAAGKDIYPFTCPHCALVFDDETSVLAEAQFKTESDRTSHPAKHFGVMYHCVPIISDYARMVLCTLHMRISFCRTLYEYTILPALVKDEKIVKQLLELLKKDGVNINRLRKMNDLNDLQTCRNASFQGKAAYQIIKRFDAYVKLANHKAPEKM